MNYIQIGTAALRDPVGGGFLPAVPLFIRGQDAKEVAEPFNHSLMELGAKVEAYRKEAQRLEAEAEEKKKARRESRRRRGHTKQEGGEDEWKT